MHDDKKGMELICCKNRKGNQNEKFYYISVKNWSQNLVRKFGKKDLVKNRISLEIGKIFCQY